jgi:hypothetical protein
LFAGSDRGGERAAIMLTLIQTAKLVKKPRTMGMRGTISNWLSGDHGDDMGTILSPW